MHGEGNRSATCEHVDQSLQFRPMCSHVAEMFPAPCILSMYCACDLYSLWQHVGWRQDPDDLTFEELFTKFCSLSVMLQGWQTIVASWVETIPDHKYAEIIKSDMSDYLLSVTESLSFVNGVIDGSIKIDNRSITALELEKKATVLQSTFSSFKELTQTMFQLTEDDTDGIAVEEQEGEQHQGGSSSSVGEQMAKRFKRAE
jgi:hypothetical protein